MGNLMIANRQWANRPDDERYTSLEALEAAVYSRREHSLEFSRPLRALADKVAVSGRELDGELTLRGSHSTIPLTHWSFGQLCSRVRAPAGYLRTLPSTIALSNLQWGMLHPPEEYDADAKVLIESPNGHQGAVRAFTSTTYGRIWDAEVVDAVMRVNQDGRWQVPAASYASSDPKRATTLYASDHDIWMFLVDPEHPVEVAGEGPLFRGFIAWNSEVGDTTFGLMTFLYERVCDNRIIWGASEVSKLTIRHTSGGPDRFLREAAPALRAYSDGSVRSLEAGIAAAKVTSVAKDRDEAQKWLEGKGFTRVASRMALQLAEQEGRDPTSLFDVQWGLTRYAQGITYQDERVAFERRAGSLLGGNGQ